MEAEVEDLAAADGPMSAYAEPPAISTGMMAPAAGVAAASAAPRWDWAALNTVLRPQLVQLGMSRFGCSREECEDALQSVFLNVLVQDRRIREPIAYLKVSFLNACRNVLATRKRWASSQDDELADRGDANAAIRLEAACSVAGAMRLIDPKCRRLLHDYFLEERSLIDTARRCGYSEKTVWKRISKCLERARECLAP